MNTTQSHLQPWVAFATWAVVFFISVKLLWAGDSLLEAVIGQVLILFFLWLSTSVKINERHSNWCLAGLWAMLLTALALSWRIQVSFFFIYSVVWIAVATHYFNSRNCWWLLLAINVAWYVIRTVSWQEEDALIETVLLSTFHVFALVSSLSARASTVANQRTQELNRELLASQHLLSEASKESERTRIARDLHDLLGHHLTALTINLQVASRLSKGEAKDKIDQCHGLSKLLLSDVREAVSTLRDSPTLDLHELLSLAIKDVPRLAIDLDVDRSLQLDNVNTADVLLRCVQEAITNTLRHSRAKSMCIRVSSGDQRLQLRISDDGEGDVNMVAGNGLLGMRERVERSGGTFEFTSGPGFQIDIDVPLLPLTSGV